MTVSRQCTAIRHLMPPRHGDRGDLHLRPVSLRRFRYRGRQRYRMRSATTGAWRAGALRNVAEGLDMAHLNRRVPEEGGAPALPGPRPGAHRRPHRRPHRCPHRRMGRSWATRHGRMRGELMGCPRATHSTMLPIRSLRLAGYGAGPNLAERTPPRLPNAPQASGRAG